MKSRIIIIISSLIFCNALIAGSSDMSIDISANSDTFFGGQRSVITATIKNLGPDTATGIQVNLAINSPIAITGININSGLENCQISTSGISCTLDSLLVNETKGLILSFIPPISDTNMYAIGFNASVHSSNSDDNQSNNNASTTIQVTSTPTQDQWGDALLDALGADSPRLRQMVGALAAYCGTNDNYETGLAGNCDDLFIQALNGNVEVINRVLRRLRPREVVQQARTSVQIIATQQANIAARMAQVRAGTTNSIAGLSISSGGDTLPIEMLSYLADGNNDSYDQFVTPWGFFINGQISSGDYRYADARDEGFDFDTDGVTAGIDYRLNAKSVIGLAMGYASFDSTVGTEATMSSSALTFSAYGSFNINDNFYMDARGSFGKPDFDQQRVVQFTIGDNQVDKNATGHTEGTQQSFIVSSGYQFNKNGWQLTPSVSAEFTKTTIDAFVETGAAAWNVGFSQQNFETSRFTLAIQANKSFSLSNGILIPSFGYELIHENQNGDEFIFMRISGMPAGEFFEVPTSFNDGDYGSGHVGLIFVAANGKQAYIHYSKVFGWDGFERATLNLGARFEF